LDASFAQLRLLASNGRLRTRRAGPVSSGASHTKYNLFKALGGAEGVLRLAHAWHQRVLADEVVVHAFSHGFHPQHTERLAAYWEAWGRPATYSQQYGSESWVVRMHSGNEPHDEMDQRAIDCFDRALEDIGLTDLALRNEQAGPTSYRRFQRCPRCGWTRTGDVEQGIALEVEHELWVTVRLPARISTSQLHAIRSVQPGNSSEPVTQFALRIRSASTVKIGPYWPKPKASDVASKLLSAGLDAEITY
jgi:hemoglobin